MVAPYANLILVLIVVILFVKLLRTHNPKRYTKPWSLIFAGVLVFIVEEIFTVLRHAEVIELPLFMNGVFEVIIIALFTFALLEQRNHTKKYYH